MAHSLFYSSIPPTSAMTFIYFFSHRQYQKKFLEQIDLCLDDVAVKVMRLPTQSFRLAQNNVICS